jgi:hypothetical protein
VPASRYVRYPTPPVAARSLLRGDRGTLKKKAPALSGAKCSPGTKKGSPAARTSARAKGFARRCWPSSPGDRPAVAAADRHRDATGDAAADCRLEAPADGEAVDIKDQRAPSRRLIHSTPTLIRLSRRARSVWFALISSQIKSCRFFIANSPPASPEDTTSRHPVLAGRL